MIPKTSGIGFSIFMQNINCGDFKTCDLIYLVNYTSTDPLSITSGLKIGGNLTESLYTTTAGFDRNYNKITLYWT
jgi:hypothetical protein